MIIDQKSFPKPELPPLPFSVQGVKRPVIDLSGCWTWSADPEDGHFQEIDLPCDMSALGLSPDLHRYTFRRIIEIPADYDGCHIRLRFDGAAYAASVFIDGHEAGRHVGGFTTWDLDITELVTPGTEATLTVVTQDAKGVLNPDNLGGLIRPIRLIALPSCFIRRLHDQTFLCKNAVDFDLLIQIETEGSSPGAISLRLMAPDGQIVMSEILPEDQVHHPIRRTLTAPLSWDAEHPRLYQLFVTLDCGQFGCETVCRFVGFRDIRWSDSQVFINGQPIKLRGVCYQDASPLKGKALSLEQLTLDLHLLKSAHVNFIRTAGRPPRPELLDLCDKLGFYVQVDAPFVQIGQDLPAVQNNPFMQEELLGQVSEMVERDKDHPSLLIWGLGSECAWGYLFRQAAAHIRSADHTRPLIFSFPMSHDRKSEPLDLWSVHYLPFGLDPAIAYDHFIIGHTPGSDDPPGYAKGYALEAKWPVLHDEIARIPCHDRDSLMRDPSVREFWGESISSHWERIRESERALGCAVWSAIDDVTVHSGGNRYNEWGILDVWRRPKPEYWHIKRTYAPIYLDQKTLARLDDGSWQILVENRFDHTNLDELSVLWQQGEKRGYITLTAAEPRKTARLILPQEALSGPVCSLSFFDAAGTLIEALPLLLPETNTNQQIPCLTSGRPRIEETPEMILIHLEDGKLCFSRQTGLICEGIWHGQTLILDGPSLQLTGLSLPDWALSRLAVSMDGNEAVITISGRYGDMVAVTFILHIGWMGYIKTTYTIDHISRPMPRTVKIYIGLDCGGLEEVGISYLLSPSVDRLSWQRKGLWDFYPGDHIGRNQGTAERSGPAHDAKLKEMPTWPWSSDERQFALYGSYDSGWRGSLDFRSMKQHILWSAVWSSQHEAAIRIYSDGSDSVRLSIEPDPDTILDDRDAAIRYLGTWYACTDKSGSLNNTETISETAGDIAEVSFTGTGIDWYGPKDLIGGIARVSVDGAPSSYAVSQYPEAVEIPGFSRGYEKRYQRLLFSVSGLEYGPHTLQIEGMGEKEKDSDFTYVLIDWFRVHRPEPDPVRLILLNQWNVRRLAWGNVTHSPVCVKDGYTGQITMQLASLPERSEEERKEGSAL